MNCFKNRLGFIFLFVRTNQSNTIMRHILLVATFIFAFTGQLFAKNYGLALFNDRGQKFKVYINGAIQNSTFMSEVKICCFADERVEVKVEFENGKTTTGTIFLRKGFIEHDYVSNTKMEFDHYERIPDEYAARTTPILLSKEPVKSAAPKPPCTTPKPNAEFFDFFRHLKEHEGFDNERLAEAQIAVIGTCFTSRQVEICMHTFTYEETRLVFAKFAYDYVYDKANFSVVKEAFLEPQSSIEFDKFLLKK